MPRLALTALACATLLGLSCSLPGTHSLPPVAAAPPTPATAPPAAAAEPQPDDADAALIAVICENLESRRRTGLTRPEIRQLARTIVTEARRREVEPELVLAVIHVESRYNAYAVSPVGAMGLMQILPATGEELAAKLGITWWGPQTLFDPFVNVRLGVAYLKELTERYGNTTSALAAYNWGPGHIDRRIRRGTPLPKAYPALVLEAYSAHAERRS
jgi:soluble lytic murein transglycosylase-like protein